MNPLLVSSLVIDDCGMSDDALEQLLLGVKAQGLLSSLHYVNNNTLGLKSGKVLIDICDRTKPGGQIRELNISNVKIGQVRLPP